MDNTKKILSDFVTCMEAEMIANGLNPRTELHPDETMEALYDDE